MNDFVKGANRPFARASLFLLCGGFGPLEIGLEISKKAEAPSLIFNKV